MYKTVCARQTGTGHKQNNIPCQDSVSAYSTDTVGCIVLADGAGSYPFSHLASEAVTDKLSKKVVDSFDEWHELSNDELRSKILITARNAVSCGIQEKCTLLLFAIHNDGRVILAHLGDGAIFGTNEKKKQHFAQRPRKRGRIQHYIFY